MRPIAGGRGLGGAGGGALHVTVMWSLAVCRSEC